MSIFDLVTTRAHTIHNVTVTSDQFANIRIRQSAVHAHNVNDPQHPKLYLHHELRAIPDVVDARQLGGRVWEITVDGDDHEDEIWIQIQNTIVDYATGEIK